MNAKWYVYELLDPRDDSVFYVGKGTGNRIYAHEKEARKGVCSYKCNKIRHLWSQNLQIKRQIVAYFWDEKAAYEHEAERIASYEYITNVVGGPLGKFVGPMPRLTNAMKYKRYEPPPKQELTVESALKMLLLRLDLLAFYLIATRGNLEKVTLDIGEKPNITTRIYKMVSEGVYNVLYPMCIKKVIGSPTDWKKVQDALLPYGVILENGSKNESNAAYA